jgi:hypothetical protein
LLRERRANLVKTTKMRMTVLLRTKTVLANVVGGLVSVYITMQMSLIWKDLMKKKL